MPLDYDKIMADVAAMQRARRLGEAERFAIAVSPIKYAPSGAWQVISLAHAENERLGLCCHGKVPRLIAERMKMPRLGCRKCA